MTSQADKEYADLMVEINECLKMFLYQTEPEPQKPQKTQKTQSKKTEWVPAALPGSPGSFVRRLPVLKTPHCGGCKKPITDSEMSHRDCITHFFKRNHIAWKNAIYLSRVSRSKTHSLS